jgi:thiamine biosynthesis lipoprotein ApbE
VKQFLRATFLCVFLCGSAIAHAKIYTREQIVFGNVSLKIQIDTSGSAQRAFRDLENSFNIARKMNAIFSTYEPESEISKINALKKPLFNYRPSTEFYAALAHGLRFSEITRGYFDITFEMPHSALDQIKLKSGRRIDLLSPDLKINLTGFIKGLTVDKIIDELKKQHRITAAIVAAGGDIRHFDREGKTVAIRLYDPISHQPGLLVELGNQAVSTSGFYERGRHVKNSRRSPIEHQQVSVIADRCLISDTFDNGMMFMPLSDIKTILAHSPHTHVIIYDRHGKIMRFDARP